MTGSISNSLISIDEAKQQYERLTNGQCKPQSSALSFDASGNFRSLDLYFPIINMLSSSETDTFYRLVQDVATHLNFDI